MAGAKAARSVRGKYSAAGYHHGERGRQMYIASVPAGSRQDQLRDMNRIGYRSDRPWNESPVPLFDGEAAAVPAQRIRRRKHESFVDKLVSHALKEKKDVFACVMLTVLILMMTAAWGQKIVAGVEIQRAILDYQENTIVIDKENERLAQRLVLAKGGERIRNLAQNELNMLRPELAHTETIYIQTPEKMSGNTVQNHDEPRMEMLDILLGLLNVFHIGE